jgi:surface antigen Omp85-like protein
MLQRVSRTAALLLLLSSLVCTSTVRAESEDRKPPDYAGRDEPPPTPGEVLIWVPRVILFPPYLVTEYLIRTPLGWVIAGAERAGVPAWLYDFFTFGPDHNGGIVPTAFLSFDFYPNVGFYAFWNDAFFRGHDLRLRGAIGGTEWLAAGFSERFHFSKDRRDMLRLDVTAERRPDYTFFGLGPFTRQDALVRYGQDTRAAALGFEQRLWRASSFNAQAGVKAIDFREGGFGGDPTLDEDIAAGELTAPPGYEDGYTIFHTGVRAALDNRLPRPEPGSGFRLSAQAEYLTHLRERGSFVRYGGAAAAFIDLNQRSRVLSVAVQARFADPIDNAEIPFTELITLGGPEPMRGLYPGRLYDRSAIVGQLGYRWPIWIWLDGALRMEVGNVFGEHLDGFKPNRLRWSGALGFESVATPDNSFQFLIGLGSETFESGGKIDSFRFAVGTTSGF